MTLREAITDDVSAVFLNTSDFAETVTYYPRSHPTSVARTPRSISAVVIRESMSQVAEDGSETILPMFEVHVANDSTTGISGEELDTGGDKIAFPVRDGEAASQRAIHRIMTQDHGMLVLECR